MTTQQAWSNHTKGEFIIPTATQLRTQKNTFGAPSMLHSFHCEPDIFNIAIYILKNPWLDIHSHIQFILSDLTLMELWKALVSLPNNQFHKLQQPDTKYATRTTIPHERVAMFTACALHYNLDMASVIRFVGGTYTASYRDVPNILKL